MSSFISSILVHLTFFFVKLTLICMLNLHVLSQLFIPMVQVIAFLSIKPCRFLQFSTVLYKYTVKKAVYTTPPFIFPAVPGCTRCRPRQCRVPFATAFMRRIPCAIGSSAWDSYFLLIMFTTFIYDDLPPHRSEGGRSAFCYGVFRHSENIRA